MTSVLGEQSGPKNQGHKYNVTEMDERRGWKNISTEKERWTGAGQSRMNLRIDGGTRRANTCH